MQVGSLTSAVGGSYAWHALTRLFQSADKNEQTLFALHLKNALRVVERSRELRGAFALIRGQLKTELGAWPERLFTHFEPEAFAAASLGQVHRARLRNGRQVVVKIQYPGVDETVEQDLKNTQALLRVLTLLTRDVLRQPFEMDEIYDEMAARLHEELDYVHEAENIRRFRRLFADDDELIIPRVFPKFSSRRVLTMDYVDGYTFQDILAPGVDTDLKDWVAIKYFQITWRQIFDFGVLHTDPQPGNYLVTYHPKISMLDFGSVRIFPPAVQIMYLIFEPVLEDRVYDPHDYHSAEKSMAVTALSLEHRIFNAPGHRLFLVRALLGLEAYVQQFRTITNWHRLFWESIERSEAAESNSPSAEA